MTRSRHLRGWFRVDDRGAATLLVVFLVVAVMLPVAAVSVDLSAAFANRRQMQNAADAAAMAGAQQLADARGGDATAADIQDAALAVAVENGQDPADPSFACEVVVADPATSPDTWPSAACTAWSGLTWNGVRVTTRNAVEAAFASTFGLLPGGSGSGDTEAGAVATASLQALESFAAGPFGLCTGGTTANVDPRRDGSTNNPLLLGSDATGWQINPAAIGQQFYIYRGTAPPGGGGGGGGGQPSDFDHCGLGDSNWNGLVCPQTQLPSVEFPSPSTSSNPCNDYVRIPTAADGVGSWVWASTGSKVGPTVDKIAGYPPCFSDGEVDLSGPVSFSPCGLVMPLCDRSNGLTGNSATVHCVAFGAFLIYPDRTWCEDIADVDPDAFPTCDPVNQTGNPNPNRGIWGVFLGSAQLIGGTPGGGTPEPGEIFVINLVQ
jgi:Flp pilus assembly protein TadG